MNEMNKGLAMSDMAVLLNKIDNIGPEYVNTVSAEMFQYQPFFLTVLLGYRTRCFSGGIGEIMKIYFLIWEYFSENPRIRIKQIREKDFEAAQLRDIIGAMCKVNRW